MPTNRQKRTLPERINRPSRSAFTVQQVSDPTSELSFVRCHACAFLFFLVTLAAFHLPLHAAGLPDYAARARKAYQEARDKHSESPKDVQLAWRFGCACFDVADFSTNNAERGDFADQGIAACNEAIAADPRCAPAHYYLGMNLGQLAQTRGLSALKLVDQMEAEFKTARQLDEKFDLGGPDRNLGLLYRDAPSWISVGSRGRATKHLLHAAELAPDYPENPLNLLESYVKWSDRNGIKRQLKIVEELWPRARKQFSGTQWELSWTNWTDRLQQVRKKINEPSRSIESPRAKD